MSSQIKKKKTNLDNMYIANSQTQAHMRCQQTQQITITHTCLFNGLWLVKLLKLGECPILPLLGEGLGYQW